MGVVIKDAAKRIGNKIKKKQKKKKEKSKAKANDDSKGDVPCTDCRCRYNTTAIGLREVHIVGLDGVRRQEGIIGPTRK